MTADNFLTFFVYALAVWRVTKLITDEDGPYFIFHRLRTAVHEMKQNKSELWNFDDGINCEWCVSIWVSFPFALLLFSPSLFNWFFLPLSASAITILFKYVIEFLQCLCENLKVKK